MKVVILAGGFGTRLSEKTQNIPKPMVNVGDKPILWHIMKLYSHYGYNDFIICLGYKGYVIKEYFANHFLHNSDVTIDIKTNNIKVHNNNSEPWRVTLVDTGLNTMTGGRIKRVKDYINGETFMLTYGDGLSDIDISKLVEFHKNHDAPATVTAVQPEGRFGTLNLISDKVVEFAEKTDNSNFWINGGFFVLEPELIDYIADDFTSWEKESLAKISKDGKLKAYFHEGFWKPMDKLVDKNYLDKLWLSGNPPWKVWRD